MPLQVRGCDITWLADKVRCLAVLPPVANQPVPLAHQLCAIWPVHI